MPEFRSVSQRLTQDLLRYGSTESTPGFTPATQRGFAHSCLLKSDTNSVCAGINAVEGGGGNT
jgi:hypothetical protein